MEAKLPVKTSQSRRVVSCKFTKTPTINTCIEFDNFLIFIQTKNRMKKITAIFILLFISINLTAQNNYNCNEKLIMGPLCSSVSDRRQDTREDSPFEYEFEERIYKLACVDINKDSKEIINKKIYYWWIQNEPEIVCTGASFNVSQGNILKLAAYNSFTAFLDRAIFDWKIPLNKVDKTDGRTTLDYIKDELERSKGQANEKALKDYYDLLRRNGAKYKSEL